MKVRRTTDTHTRLIELHIGSHLGEHMEILLLAGRIVLAILFLGAGFGHFKSTAAMAGYAQSKGIPAAKAMVQLTGVMCIVGGVLLATGFYVDLGAIILFAFLVPTAILMHPFWKETDAMAKMNEQMAFNKDMAIAGALLAIFALYQIAGAVDSALYGTLFFK